MKRTPRMVLRFGLALLGLLAALAAGRSRADDFRVENKIFVAGEKEPSTRSTTIFYNGLVYDFLANPGEITIFDKAHARFILLDTAGKFRTELPLEQIAGLNEKLKAWAAEQSDPFLNFTADPKFTEEFDKANGVLKLDSSWITYRVTMMDAPSEAVARQYREFSDWYVKLNTRINPGGRLPYPRLAVNAALEGRHQLPRAVELSMRPKKLSLQRINVRSEHQLVHTLVDSDRQRVTQALEFVAIFNPLEFDQYQKKLKRAE
jgi:hypothetical protein